MAVFGIETLKGIIGGFAKGNRYNVSFSGLPAGLDATVNEKVQYLCESVSLPTKGIASTPQIIYGPSREIPYGETFTEAALSFIVDGFLVKVLTKRNIALCFFDKLADSKFEIHSCSVKPRPLHWLIDSNIAVSTFDSSQAATSRSPVPMATSFTDRERFILPSSICLRTYCRFSIFKPNS